VTAAATSKLSQGRHTRGGHPQAKGIGFSAGFQPRTCALLRTRKPRLSRGFIEEAHTGFEPVSREVQLPEPLRRKLTELRLQSDTRVRRGRQ